MLFIQRMLIDMNVYCNRRFANYHSICLDESRQKVLDEGPLRIDLDGLEVPQNLHHFWSPKMLIAFEDKQ